MNLNHVQWKINSLFFLQGVFHFQYAFLQRTQVSSKLLERIRDVIRETSPAPGFIQQISGCVIEIVVQRNGFR